MFEPLLHTKLVIPPVRPNLVPRPRLIERLNQGLQLAHRLSLISAPAGFGKTTLVVEWASHLRSEAANGSQGDYRVAWLSLDEGDNDLARFLAYLIASLRQAEGMETPIGKGVMSMLQSPQPPPAEDVLTSLINEIAHVPDRIVLFIDDYHLIDSSQVDEALTFLLRHLPPQMHLVIATRSDPNLPLANFRVRGQLTELRAADLRFTSSEAAEFLNRVMGLDLSAADIAALESRTEGWIAGLQLTAISMKGREDVTAFVESFTGSHHFVLDYLIEDVLEHQPDNAQAFLLQTAILNRMTGSLCDAVTGLDNGQATLETLERDNLFIVALDEERRWYRYHQLFSDVLRQRLRQTQPGQETRLHQQASEWYERNGFIGEAIEHGLLAKSYERAAHLINEHIDALWAQGKNRDLQRWLDRLPEKIVLSSPNLSIFQARYQCNSGKLDAAEQTLEAAERAIESSTERRSETEPHEPPSFTDSERVKLRARVAATRALISSYRGDAQGIIHYANQALANLPVKDLTWRSVTAIALGNAHGFKGDMTAAYEARYEALKACEAAGDLYFIIIANLELAITLREQGRLKRTIQICQEQLRFAAENGLSQTRTVGWLLAVWGETLAELNDLAGAIDRATQGFELTERSRDMQMLGWSFMCLIRILISRGDLAEAEETIQRMQRIARESSFPPWIAGQMAAWQARLWLAQDNLEAASRWMEGSGLYMGEGPRPLPEIDFFLLFDCLVVTRILIAQGRLERSTELLQHLLMAAEAGGRTSSAITILTLQALTFQAGGEITRALSTLEQALTLAEPEGFIRIFVDEGKPMADLLNEALGQRIAPNYVRQLLAAFTSDEAEQAASLQAGAPGSEWVEPLSEREREVLQLVAEGLTNREIASRLFLSLNTIKVHTRNINGKLGTHNRTQAVAKARALGILPAT
jgi:LuxR family maltose regulon positive regulatory protein